MKSLDTPNHKPLITRNLHTHQWYCLHADGTVDDFCRYAQKINMTMIGMSDHVPMPHDPVDDDRMSMEQLDDYSTAIDQAKLDYPDLIVLKGMECEALSAFYQYYRDELLIKREFDYLACAIHYVDVNGTRLNLFEDSLDVKGLRAFVDHFVNALEADLFTFMVHPDLFGFTYPNWDANVEACVRDMMQAAVAYDMPLEINSKGFRRPQIQTNNGMRYRYPWFQYWEVAAEYNIRVLINTDAHRPSELDATVAEARALKDRYGLREISDEAILARMCELAQRNRVSVKPGSTRSDVSKKTRGVCV
ncbi:histidinol-phosphatase [candidate division KSB1 bacterium]|nr:histidinol-phosphatase [candidate division KSB1 bacterium]